MFNNNLLRLRRILMTLLNSHLSAKKVQGRLPKSRNYSLIISIQTPLRLNRNQLSRFIHLEENVTILRIKTIDKSRKRTKGISHVTSVVILLVRTCNLCRKRGHFAKCCNSSKRRVNLVQENEEKSGLSID